MTNTSSSQMMLPLEVLKKFQHGYNNEMFSDHLLKIVSPTFQRNKTNSGGKGMFQPIKKRKLDENVLGSPDMEEPSSKQESLDHEVDEINEQKNFNDVSAVNDSRLQHEGSLENMDNPTHPFDTTAELLANIGEGSPINVSPREDEVEEEVTEADQIHVNSLVLSAYSPYFRALFTNGMKETKEKAISVHVSKEDRPFFKDLIRFLYTGEFQNGRNDLLRMLILADQFQIEVALGECTRLLSQEELTVESCCHIIDTLSESGRNQSFEPILKQCKSFLKSKFEDLDNQTTREELLHLSWRGVVVVLGNARLQVYSENTVFQALRSWFKHDQSRIQHSNLLHLVRWSLMTPDFLNGVVLNCDIIQKLEPNFQIQLKDLLCQCIQYNLSCSETRTVMSELRTDYKKLPFQERLRTEALEQRKYSPFDWSISNIATMSEEQRSPKFFAHGYYLYLNARKESGSHSIAVTLHIDCKSTGIRNIPVHISTLHYQLYFKHLGTSQYVPVGTVDHYWTRDSGWGKSVKIPGAGFIGADGSMGVRIFVALGKCPNPSAALPPIPY